MFVDRVSANRTYIKKINIYGRRKLNVEFIISMVVYAEVLIDKFILQGNRDFSIS